MKADPIEVRDSLVRDAVEPARDSGREVNVRAASDYVVGVLQTLEQKNADAKPVQTESKADAVASEYEKATGRKLDGKSKVERRESTLDSFVHQDTLRVVGEHRLVERLRWIRQRPDLFNKIKGAAIMLNSPDANVRAKAKAKVIKALDQSNRLAGYDWRKPKPKKLFF